MTETAPFDIIFVLPYPFSDHPSFPEGILKRVLEAEGFRVGVLEAPFWQKLDSFTRLGRPRLFFAVISGPVDSMILNYTSTHKRRKEDLYQFDGKAFFEGCPPSIKYKIRPDRTTIVFSNRLREAYREVPIVIGGVEAALRRFCHYDFHQNRIRRSILLDSRADILVTGMGEKQLVRVARQIQAGAKPGEVNAMGITKISKGSPPGDHVELPSLEAIENDPLKLLEGQIRMEKGRREGRTLLQKHASSCIVETPAEQYSQADLDRVYGFPYRRAHLERGVLSPALQMNLFSITSHRGCGGGCSFCAIGSHQGRQVLSRSMESILAEIRSFSVHPRWKGYISDIGGGTAELYGSDCSSEECTRSSCLTTPPCPKVRTSGYRDLLKACRKLPGVRKIFLGSGIRYDLMVKDPVLLEEIMVYHSGGFLRIAPEHTERGVLDLMGKPSFSVLEEFVRLFDSINSKMKRKIELAPYLLVGHPGETFRDVLEMKKKMRSLHLKTTEVQIFTPSPGTIATAMYWAEVSREFKPIPVEKEMGEIQRRKDHLLQG
jgi:uncharacterized radical SAM protein YgiQ